MNENIPELWKGYVCPSLEDCSKCPFLKTDCIIYSRKGRARAEAYYKEREKTENDRRSDRML